LALHNNDGPVFIVSEIKRDIGRKSQILYETPPQGDPSEFVPTQNSIFLFVKSGRYHSAASPSSLSKNYVFIENTQCFYIELDFGVTPSECRPDRNNIINPLIATLKPQSKKPLYNNTVIGTLAVDGWAVTFDTARRGMVGAAARPGPSSLYQM